MRAFKFLGRGAPGRFSRHVWPPPTGGWGARVREDARTTTSELVDEDGQPLQRTTGWYEQVIPSAEGVRVRIAERDR